MPTCVADAITANLTVSLTTTSRRIDRVHEVIEALLAQTVTPARVILWLSTEPHLVDNGVREQDVPGSLRALQDAQARFAIRWTRNLGPYRKLLPALETFGDTIVTADDDTRYPPSWLAELIAMHRQYPDAVCCYRAHRMLVNDAGEFVSYWRWPAFDSLAPSLDCFPTGKDGVLYPPGSLHDDVFDAEKFLVLAPTNDDIWFKTMALRRGTRALGVRGHEAFPLMSASDHLNGLYARYNLLGNDETLVRVFDEYQLPPDKVVGSEQQRPQKQSLKHS